MKLRKECECCGKNRLLKYYIGLSKGYCKQCRKNRLKPTTIKKLRSFKKHRPFPIRTKLRTIHASIISRCYNENVIPFKWYGGRGIKIHSHWKNDWLSFAIYVYTLPDFDSDNIGLAYNNISLDRIDNDADYEPGNLRWATKREQFENSSQSHIQTHFPASKNYSNKYPEMLNIVKNIK